jgi:hypothetical protein
LLGVTHMQYDENLIARLPDSNLPEGPRHKDRMEQYNGCCDKAETVPSSPGDDLQGGYTLAQLGIVDTVACLSQE